MVSWDQRSLSLGKVCVPMQGRLVRSVLKRLEFSQDGARTFTLDLQHVILVL